MLALELLVDKDMTIRYVSPSAHEFFGMDVVEKNVFDYTSPYVAKIHRSKAALKAHAHPPAPDPAKPMSFVRVHRYVMYDAQKNPFMCTVDVSRSRSETFPDSFLLRVTPSDGDLGIMDAVPSTCQRNITTHGENIRQGHRSCIELKNYANVTCVLMDLSSSTEFVSTHPDGCEMANMLANLYREALDEVIPFYPYVYIHELTGDSVFLVVNGPWMVKHHEPAVSATIAVYVSLRIQRRVNASLPDGMHLRVGIAQGQVSAGVIDGRTFRIFGKPVHLAQRLESVCRKDCVCLCEASGNALALSVSVSEVSEQCSAWLKGLGPTSYSVVHSETGSGSGSGSAHYDRLTSTLREAIFKCN